MRTTCPYCGVGCGLKAERSRPAADNDAAVAADGVTIRLRQSDLAQLAGTSRESVSRFLATLERAGVVQFGRGRVTILEPERLGSYIF